MTFKKLKNSIFIFFLIIGGKAYSQNCAVGVAKELTPKHTFQSTAYALGITNPGASNSSQFLIKKSLLTSTTDSKELERRLTFVKNCQKYALISQTDPDRFVINFYSEDAAAYRLDGTTCIVTVDETNYANSYCSLKSK